MDSNIKDKYESTLNNELMMSFKLSEEEKNIILKIEDLIINEKCFDDEDTKTMLWAIPHLIRETDKSQLAATRYKRIVMKCYTPAIPQLKKLFAEVSKHKFEEILHL